MGSESSGDLFPKTARKDPNPILTFPFCSTILYSYSSLLTLLITKLPSYDALDLHECIWHSTAALHNQNTIQNSQTPPGGVRSCRIAIGVSFGN